MKNVLVTGAGALLGQGILRCLNSSGTYNIISADPDVQSTGHALARKSYKIPYVSAKGYLDRIEEIILKEKINIILIGTDVELPLFAAKKSYLEEKYDLLVVVSNSQVVEMANDKWLTAQFLKENNFPYPFSALTTDKIGIEELKVNSEFPFIAKPIDGARSKGIVIIETEEELQKICSYKNNLVVQEKLSEAEGEFTTGCLVVDGKCVAVVSMTRILRDGNTWRAFRKNESPYDLKIAQIAESLGVEGPANFQYRIKDGEPVVFEINCRFSGTTPLRLIYGFNEVVALLDYYIYKKEIVVPNLKEGTILRTFSDILVPNKTIAEFDKRGFTEEYNSIYYPFKVNKK